MELASRQVQEICCWVTISGVNSIESDMRGALIVSITGRELVSSQVKTLEKYSLNIVAISTSELAVELSERRNSVMPGRVLTLELTYCQKAFGLDFMFWISWLS